MIGDDTLKLYVEYIDENGNFQNDFFYDWDSYHAATFNPDIQILGIKLFDNGKTKTWVNNLTDPNGGR